MHGLVLRQRYLRHFLSVVETNDQYNTLRTYIPLVSLSAYRIYSLSVYLLRSIFFKYSGYIFVLPYLFMF